MPTLTRRQFICASTGVLAAGTRAQAGDSTAFRLRYVLSTSVYGNLPIADIVAEVAAAGCDGLDIWAGRWGNQREQIEALGPEKFSALLEQHRTRVRCYTCMDTGLLKAEPQMRPMKRFGGDLIVAMIGGGGGPNLRGAELRAAIHAQVARLRPAFDASAEAGVRLAIENHSGGILASPDSLGLLVDAIPQTHVGLAFAPYHLPQDPALLGKLIGELGERLFYFYAWQHGDGSGDLPPPRQRRQLPGVGPLDFKPMLAALKRIRFAGPTSIFMHPTPRGSPIHPTVAETTAELNRAGAYLESELARA